VDADAAHSFCAPVPALEVETMGRIRQLTAVIPVEDEPMTNAALTSLRGPTGCETLQVRDDLPVAVPRLEEASLENFI
jgi:hypothetical protein